MDDDKAGDGSHATSVPPSGPRKRPAPTIDLTASKVTETAPLAPAGEAADEPASVPEPAPQSHIETKPEADADASAGDAQSQNSDSQDSPSDGRRPLSSTLLVPALTGAATAAVIIGAALLLGWPQATVSPPSVQDNSAIDALGARLARVEAKASAPAPAPAQSNTTDPALTARLAALDTALTALRGDLGKLRAQSDAANTAIAALKAAPRESAPQQDLSAIEGRLGKLETATAALATPPPRAAAVNEAALSRLAAATLLDQAVHQSEPYAAALAAVAKLNVPSASLQPLEAFASTGVPSVSALGDDLLKQLPNLAPQAAPQPAINAASDGILDRLQHSAAKLVRIQRIDDAAAARLALIARVKAAAERGDILEARRALLTLPETDRAPVQPWLGKVAAREAALAASHTIAQQALTALAAPATPGTPR